MNRKRELDIVKQYFKRHPDQNKYSRSISGLSSSYLRDPHGKIIRLHHEEGKQHILGFGKTGRIKKSESMNNAQQTAIKIQTYPLEYANEMMSDFENEAAINNDLGIATGPLSTRIDNDKQLVKIYQEMYIFKESLAARIPKMDAEQKMKSAIEVLLAIDNLHTGSASKSYTPYYHGDIGVYNMMYDNNNHLRLIDFGDSAVLNHPSQLTEDLKSALTTLFYRNTDGLTDAPSIFQPTEFDNFPEHIQNIMDWSKKSELSVQPEQALRYIAAVLIAYHLNKDISKQDIETLKSNIPKQNFLIEQHNRQQNILALADNTSQKLIYRIEKTLIQYQHFLKNEIDKTNSSNLTTDRALMEKKQAIILSLLSDINARSAEPTQKKLAYIDSQLAAHHKILSRESISNDKGIFGLIMRTISNKSHGSSLTSIDTCIDKHLGETCSDYRAALNTFKEQTTVDDSSDRSIFKT